MIDGSITIWEFEKHKNIFEKMKNKNIESSKTSILIEQQLKIHPSSVLVDSRLLYASEPGLSALSCLKYCPFDKNLLVSGGMNGYYKVSKLKLIFYFNNEVNR